MKTNEETTSAHTKQIPKPTLINKYRKYVKLAGNVEQTWDSATFLISW